MDFGILDVLSIKLQRMRHVTLDQVLLRVVLIPFGCHGYTNVTVHNAAQKESNIKTLLLHFVDKASHFIPRPPRSGTHLCRWGKPGIFSDVSSVKGREGVERS